MNSGSSSRFCYRSAIAHFFRTTTQQQPWWYSLLDEVNGHAESSLFFILGLPFDLYARICVKACLFKKKQQKGDTIYIPILSDWNQLISEFNLTCYLEDVNITKIDGKRYYFINIGSRKKQFHSPKDQFNGRVEPPSMLPFLHRSRRILRDMLEEEARWQSTTSEDWIRA